MLQASNQGLRELLLEGNFGLEKEGLRTDARGYLAHTPHPFPEDRHIVRDFSENQTEIDTTVFHSAQAAVDELEHYTGIIQRRLCRMEPQEHLWLFSNPPYIRREEDIPIAHFEGNSVSKTKYREYLSDRYGRYRMTFSGIHVNFSFGDQLLKKAFELDGSADFRSFKDRLYLDLAERMVAYGWLLVAISAASPVGDMSFVKKGTYDEDLFMGMASVRCSELGYWNSFSPVLDYSSIEGYADSIQKYVDDGILKAPSELYYPIRLKPPGDNTLAQLRDRGVSHIELRMFDLNPLFKAGLNVLDVQFAQLLMVWLASTPRQPFTKRDQVQAVANFKNAAHYDLKTVKIFVPNGEVYTVAAAALKIIGFMKEFYKDFPDAVKAVINYQELKFIDPDNYRYAWRIYREFTPGFVKKGLELTSRLQEEFSRG